MSASWWSAYHSAHPPNPSSDNGEMFRCRGDTHRPPIRPGRQYSNEAHRVPFANIQSGFVRTLLPSVEPPPFPSLLDLSRPLSHRQAQPARGVAPAPMYYARPLRSRRHHGNAPSFTTVQEPDTPSPPPSRLRYPAGDTPSYATSQPLESPSRPDSRLRYDVDAPSFTTGKTSGPPSRPPSRLRHSVAAEDAPSFTTVQLSDQPSRPPSRLRYPVAAGDFVPATSSAPQSGGLGIVKEEGSATKSPAAPRDDSASLKARVAVLDLLNVHANVPVPRRPTSVTEVEQQVAGQDMAKKKKTDKIAMVEKGTMVENVAMVEKATMTDPPADYDFAVTKSPSPVPTPPRIRPPPGFPPPSEKQQQELKRSNTVAWFYPPEIRSSIDIWDHDRGTEERRLTDWPSFDQMKDAGDQRAERRKPRLLSIPQYHSLDARSVFSAAKGKDGMVDPGSAAAAAATSFTFVPLLFRKYAIDLIGPVNRYPIPCDNDGIIATMQVAELDYDTGDIKDNTKEDGATSVTVVVNGD
ncbi:hypothetical protein PGQ11_008934 [Apiospora arundinis]|uniref:Uncharacterized protein n=1 Tax=Apiospora arundinis TaxID=335852 RepID=A0ABR2IGS6_9PEZI